MNTESKKKSITMAQEINEALTTLDAVTAEGAEEREIIEAKNIVAGVLRNYKNFLQDVPSEDRDEVQRIFSKKIEGLALKARQIAN